MDKVFQLPSTDQPYGFLGIPQARTIVGNYTIQLSDKGKTLYHPGTDTTARTITYPRNMPLDFVVTIINDTSAGVITITTADTMILAGAGTTGDRSLAANGICTICQMTTNRSIANGTGLT